MGTIKRPPPVRTAEAGTRKAVRHRPPDVVAVGVSATGPVDPATGRLFRPPNTGGGLAGLDLAGLLRGETCLPERGERDTNCAVLAEGAYGAAVRMISWSVAVGSLFAVALLLLGGLIPRLFTGDAAVIGRAAEIWPLFALMQPVGAAVFALDGILIGAGDTRFLKWSMLAALAAFAPLALGALSSVSGSSGCGSPCWC